MGRVLLAPDTSLAGRSRIEKKENRNRLILSKMIRKATLMSGSCRSVAHSLVKRSYGRTQINALPGRGIMDQRWLTGISPRMVTTARTNVQGMQGPLKIPCMQFSTTTSKSSSMGEIKWWHPVVGGLVITIAGGMKWFHDHLGGMEGLQRSVSFYSKAIPKVCYIRQK